MKNATATFFLMAALAWTPAARALLLTTWKLPSNADALEEEYKASTNVVTVLEWNTSANGENVTMLYRSPTSGKLAAMSMGEKEFLSSFRFVKGSKGGIKGGSAPGGAVAYDESTYHPTNWVGTASTTGEDFGFSGFWEFKKGEANAVTTIRERDAEGDAGFSVTSKSGEVVVGRQLADPLEGGRFEVTSWSYVGEDFRGFALYGEKGELIRWGVGPETVTEEHHQAFVYSTDGGNLYAPISEELPAGYYLDYSLTWERTADGWEFGLTAFDGTAETRWDYGNSFFGTYAITLPDADVPLDSVMHSVTAVAAIVNTTLPTDRPTEMVFEYVEVYPQAVPEPGTLSLLAAGLSLLAVRRFRRR